MPKDILKYKRGMVFWIEDPNDKMKNNNTIRVNNRDFRSCVMAGTRPWIVVSNDASNEASNLCNVIPITSAKDPSEDVPYHIQFYFRGEHYTILPEQIKTVDGICLGSYIYTLSDRVMEQIERVIMVQFGIKQKISCTEEVLREVIDLIEPTIKKSIINKANSCRTIYSVENIEDIALKIGQDIEDLFMEILHQKVHITLQNM